MLLCANNALKQKSIDLSIAFYVVTCTSIQRSKTGVSLH
jgi:hypothetical protein